MFIVPMSRHAIGLLCGRLNAKQYVTEIEAINAKLDKGKKTNFPYPRKNQCEADFQTLVGMNRQLLIDRIRQLIKVSKQHRHFSPFYLEANHELTSSTDIPYMLSKRQMKKRFYHLQSTVEKNSKLSKEDLAGFDNYLNLSNLDKFSDKTTNLTNVPHQVRSLKICDLIEVFKSRPDGESLLRAVFEASLETDRTLRVSVIYISYKMNHII